MWEHVNTGLHAVFGYGQEKKDRAMSLSAVSVEQARVIFSATLYFLINDQSTSTLFWTSWVEGCFKFLRFPALKCSDAIHIAGTQEVPEFVNLFDDDILPTENIRERPPAMNSHKRQKFNEQKRKQATLDSFSQFKSTSSIGLTSPVAVPSIDNAHVQVVRLEIEGI